MSNLMWGGLLAALVVGSSSGAYVLSQGEHAAVLDSDLCRTDQPLTAHRVTILDTSEVLSADERRITRHVVDTEAASAAPYEKVSVLAIEAARPFEPKRLFSACAPKRGSDAKGISENPKLYEDIWEHRFGAPLDKAVGDELLAGSQDHSPLIESIWAVSRLYDFGPDVSQRRLVIAGDMLQNTPSFSQYANSSSFNAYARTNFGRLHLPDLRGVEVVIVYLARPATLRLQTKKHAQFWVDFFKAAGASKVEVVGGTES